VIVNLVYKRNFGGAYFTGIKKGAKCSLVLYKNII